jgi:hypothetical protein
MAMATIRSTYTLDRDTMRALDEMARRWGVSKSEALRRAVRSAAGKRRTNGGDALTALDRLQESLSLTPAKALDWTRSVRKERRASASRHEPGRR